MIVGVCSGTRKSDAKIMERGDDTKYTFARKTFGSDTVQKVLILNQLVRPSVGEGNASFSKSTSSAI